MGIKRSFVSMKKHIKYAFSHIDIFTSIALLLCFAFALAGSLVSVHRYFQYEAFYYDFGIFDQAIWKVAHFSSPVISHLVVDGKWIFADHFNPSIFLLSPLYWLTDRREIILVVQACIVAMSGWILYLIGWHVLKSKLQSLAVLVCYLLFVGLQNAVITDFHEVTIAVLPFLLTYLAFFKKKNLWYFVAFLVMLGCKESNFLVGLGMGISIFLIQRSAWKLAITTCALAALWGYLSIHIVIPYFSGGIYQYGVDLAYNPITIVGTFFDNPVKLRTLQYSFLSFGFLPILGYQFWALIFQDILTRFYSPLWALRWGLGLHYSAMLGAIMGLGSLCGFRVLSRFISKRIVLNIVAIALIVNAIILYRFILHGPFALSYNPQFYVHSKDFVFLNTLVAHVPANATVMAQNNLAIRFDHQQVWVMESDPVKFVPDFYVTKKPQYIVLDVRDGQNPNDWFLIKDVQSLLIQIQQDPQYIVIYHTKDQFVFKRK